MDTSRLFRNFSKHFLVFLLEMLVWLLVCLKTKHNLKHWSLRSCCCSSWCHCQFHRRKNFKAIRKQIQAINVFRYHFWDSCCRVQQLSSDPVWFLKCVRSQCAIPRVHISLPFRANHMFFRLPNYGARETCSDSCHCDSFFNPVCSEDSKLTFLSPCHAGCQDVPVN